MCTGTYAGSSHSASKYEQTMNINGVNTTINAPMEFVIFWIKS